jgi:hypothetical protein
VISGRRWVRAGRVALLSAGLLASLTAVAIAGVDGATGTGPALKLVRQLLRREQRVTAVLWHQTGGFYQCSGPEQVQAGSNPGDGCRAASFVIQQDLGKGKITAQITTITASGLPTETEVSTTKGSWTRYGTPRCWRKVGDGQAPEAALTYDDEHMTIASQHGTTVILRGTAAGFQELDTIDTGTDLIDAVALSQAAAGGISRTEETFTYPSRSFAVPRIAPLCPEVTKFSS